MFTDFVNECRADMLARNAALEAEIVNTGIESKSTEILQPIAAAA